MGEVAKLVAEFSPRIWPATDPAGAEAFRVTVGEFRHAVRLLGDIEAEVVGGLRGLLNDRDWARVVLWLEVASARPNCGLVEPLCELLSVRDGYLQQEWVAELLGEIGDPRAVAALGDACSFEVEGDAFRSLPKRCLQSLAAIGTPDAQAAVESQLLSPWPEVRREAAEILAGGQAPDA